MIARVALLVAVLLLFCGCGLRVVGTNDTTLDYAIPEGPSRDATVVLRIRNRLASASLPASVWSPAARRLRVVLDTREAGAADRLLRWDGALQVYQVDASVPASTTLMKAPPGRIVAYEFVGGETYQYHVLYPTPLLVGAELPLTRIGWADGERALALTFAPSAQDRIKAVAHTVPAGTPVALVGPAGHALDVFPVDRLATVPVVVPFGKDLYAYARARSTAGTLFAGRTPPLRRLETYRTPLEPRLAVACIAFPILISIGWLLALRRLDRAQPEPFWLLGVTFALGALSQLGAYVEIVIQRLSQFTNLQAMARGHDLDSLSGEFGMTFLIVGVVEEGLKLAAVWVFAKRRRHFDEPVDGMVYAGVAALGFAAMENLFYFAAYRATGSVVSIRGLESVPMHVLFSAVWGYGMGRKLVYPQTRVLPYFIVAAAGHALFDSLLTLGMAWGAKALFVVFGVAFVVLLRKCLRHGAVRPASMAGSTADAAPPSVARQFFRVGSLVGFGASVTVMLACGWVLVGMAGASPVGEEPADGWSLLARGFVLLALFALAFFGASATMPLDVALDARGLTYAGAFHPWSSLGPPKGFQRRVVIPTQRGVVRIGFVRRRTVERLVAGIASFRGAAGFVDTEVDDEGSPASRGSEAPPIAGPLPGSA